MNYYIGGEREKKKCKLFIPFSKYTAIVKHRMGKAIFFFPPNLSGTKLAKENDRREPDPLRQSQV